MKLEKLSNIFFNLFEELNFFFDYDVVTMAMNDSSDE